MIAASLTGCGGDLDTILVQNPQENSQIASGFNAHDIIMKSKRHLEGTCTAMSMFLYMQVALFLRNIGYHCFYTTVCGAFPFFMHISLSGCGYYMVAKSYIQNLKQSLSSTI